MILPYLAYLFTSGAQPTKPSTLKLKGTNARQFALIHHLIMPGGREPLFPALQEYRFTFGAAPCLDSSAHQNQGLLTSRDLRTQTHTSGSATSVIFHVYTQQILVSRLTACPVCEHTPLDDGTLQSSWAKADTLQHGVSPRGAPLHSPAH